MLPPVRTQKKNAMGLVRLDEDTGCGENVRCGQRAQPHHSYRGDAPLGLGMPP